jgi:hypothetical protein
MVSLWLALVSFGWGLLPQAVKAQASDGGACPRSSALPLVQTRAFRAPPSGRVIPLNPAVGL